ncbi:RNA 2',3'-cyclic phosphodiesterase [Microvirga sp. CF3062]|uniref:RNA 2',3'-cyclic phosphodiesterase n=1 Tax=Microvirga sp. CF3062 TaxID=3110182 RepID=UPI002E76C3BB|nr:RNA 2',3'-cyclic phosphodiesterase [Microvirga sp. CF3062]MEE1656668.1 RNA 2',3'-cyclic phosphodiesterase [Microvirga sp. CF3062]
MPRLFTGIEIPAEIGLALSSFRGGLPGARWVEPENYHITLRFIGDIDERMADDVASILGERRQRAPLSITIDGLDSFGGSKPRAVFARTSGNGELNELQGEQERLLRQVGLAPETRKFTPHITLARLKQASPIDVANYIATRGHFPKLTFTAHRFVLYSSRASVGGGPYVIEAAYPLS